MADPKLPPGFEPLTDEAPALPPGFEPYVGPDFSNVQGGMSETARRRPGVLEFIGEEVRKPLGQTIAEIPSEAAAATESLGRGVASGLSRLGGTATFLGMGPAAAIDWAAGTSLADRLGGITEQYFRDADAYVRDDPNRNPLAFIPQAAGSVGVDLATALATGGEATAAQAAVQQPIRQAIAESAERAVRQGVAASLAPSAVRGAQLGTQVIDAGGTLPEAYGAAATGAAANTLGFIAPGAASGSFGSRLAQGALVEPAFGYLQQEAENLALADRLGLDQAYDARALATDVLLGGGLAGAIGDRGQAPLNDPVTMRGRTETNLADAAAAQREADLVAAAMDAEPPLPPGFVPAPESASPPDAAAPARSAEPSVTPPVRPVEQAVGSAAPAPAPARDTAATAQGAAPDTQTVYHGSRRAGITRPTLDRVGTGTGDSINGWGVNFASNREGSDAIRTATSSIGRVPGGRLADEAMRAAGGDRARAAEALRRDRRFAPEARRPEIDQAIEALRREPNRGTTYATEIPADSRLLAWDQPVSEQPPAVRAALESLGVTDPAMRGSQAYRALAEQLGGQRQASEALGAAGVPGQRYSDGRGGQHYVVWDEASIADFRDADAQPARTEPDVGEVIETVRRPESGLERPASNAPVAPAPSTPGGAAPARGFPAGIRQAATDAEAADLGAEPVDRSGRRQGWDAALSEARDTTAADPSYIPSLLARHEADPSRGVLTNVESMALLDFTSRQRAERNAIESRLADPNLPAAERAQLEYNRDALNSDILRSLAVFDTAGSNTGRALQARMAEMREDFTLQSMERREAATRGRELTAEERGQLQAMADKIADLTKRLEDSQRRVAEFEADKGVREAYAAALREVTAAARTAKRSGRSRLDVLRERAEASRKALKAIPDVPNRRGQSGAVIDPTAFIHLANIGAYHIANGAVKLADFVARMRDELGAAFGVWEPRMPDLYAQAVNLDRATRDTSQVPRSVEEVVASIDPAAVEPHDVNALAAAHIRAGLRGEGAVMQAVAADIASVVGGFTEADARRLFAEYGRRKNPTRDEDQAALNNLRSLVRMGEEIARLEAGLPRTAGPERAKASAELQAKRNRLNALLRDAARKDPARAAAYQQRRIEELNKRIADLQDQLATGRRPAPQQRQPESAEIESMRQQVHDLVNERRRADADLRRAMRDPEADWQAARGRSLQQQIDRLRQRIAAGDYAPQAARPPRRLTAENERLAYELDQAKREFIERQFLAGLAKRTRWGKALDNTTSGLNLARAIMTSLDLSAYLRQGGMIAFSHPIRTAKSLPDVLRSALSEEAAHTSDQKILNRPNAPLYKKAKLAITDRRSPNLRDREEEFMTRWINYRPRVPGQPVRNVARTTSNIALAPFRASNRAYSATLNRMRADMFDAMIATLSRSGEPTMEEARAVANYVNAATGRGSLGQFELAAQGMNTVFFAPRYVASRFQVLLGQPLYGGSARTRKLIASEYARYAAGLAALYAGAQLWRIGSGAEEEDERRDERRPFIETDPRSSSFGEMRIGDTFIDPLSGLAEPTTLMARVATGSTKSGAGEVQSLRWGGSMADGESPDFGQRDLVDILASFARSKLAPVPGAALSAAVGKDPVGQQTGPVKEAMGLVTPMSAEQTVDIMEAHGAAGAPLVAAGIGGMGVNVRDRATYKAPDYASLSVPMRMRYGEYLRQVQNVQQDTDELREYANALPADMHPSDVRAAVEAKASELGLGGVSVATYSPRTTARDDRGVRRRGVQRTESGALKLEFEKTGPAKAAQDSEEAIGKINKEIERIMAGDIPQEELAAVYRKYIAEDLPEGAGKQPVIDALAGERDRLVNAYLSASE